MHVDPSQFVLTREGIVGRVIPNAVDTQVYAQGKGRKIQGRRLFLGRLIEEKGVAVLLEACDLLVKKGHKFTLEIQFMVRDRGLGPYVSLTSQPLEWQLIEKIQQASVVCAPTLNAEPFGIVRLEAMST